MPASPKARIKLPETIASGDVIEVKALVTHIMETGNRRDGAGNRIPRNIIHTLIARYSGREVFRAEFSSGISANPFVAFYLRVTGPGDIELTWIDDDGNRIVERTPLVVS